MINQIKKRTAIILCISAVILSACIQEEQGKKKAYATTESIEPEKNESEEADLKRKIKIQKEKPSLMEKVAGENEYYLDALQYQISLPCSFLMHVIADNPTEVCEYRNINTDNILDEWGNVALKYTKDAYIADAVLDKYIREYGGEDTKYRIRDITGERLQELDELIYCTEFIEVFNEDTTLTVTWKLYYDNIVSVSIDGMDDEEAHTQEFLTYLQYVPKYLKCSHINFEPDRFLMIINTELTKEKYHYRNVNPDEILPGRSSQSCGTLEYYIADKVIDKYIRAYGGNDVMYKVRLISKEKDEKGDVYKYVLSVENEEEMLLVEYADNSWFVNVSIKEKLSY